MLLSSNQNEKIILEIKNQFSDKIIKEKSNIIIAEKLDTSDETINNNNNNLNNVSRE